MVGKFIAYLIGDGFVSKQTIKKEPFYTKIINEENVAKIEKPKKICNCFWRILFMLAFAHAPGLIATFSGYGFEHSFTIYMFCVQIILFVASIYLLIRHYFIMKKYNVFKKSSYFWGIHIINYVLAIGTCVSAYFNTTFSILDNGFEVRIWSGYYLFVFIPLLCLYVFFLDIMYIKCIRINVLEALKENKSKEEINKEEPIVDDIDINEFDPNSNCDKPFEEDDENTND